MKPLWTEYSYGMHLMQLVGGERGGRGGGIAKIFIFWVEGSVVLMWGSNFLGGGGVGERLGILKENLKLYNPSIKSIFRI